MINLFPLLRPFIFMMDPEKAHNLTVQALKHGASAVFLPPEIDPILSSTTFGLPFPSPVGLAAGFDKNGEAIKGGFNCGFGFVEVGTVTPLPQLGNPTPRLFRLREDQAVINRFGFNNKGLDYFRENLEKFKAIAGKTGPKGLVGANIGANKDAADRTADYVTCLKSLYGLSDYFTVNISSPNTPGLRALQSRAALETLVNKVTEARRDCMQAGESYIPILVKIAPDLTEADKEDIAQIAMQSDIDGLIVTNTTLERPESLSSHHKSEVGGLSGAPLFEPSTRVLSEIYTLTKGTVPLIGVGGIATAEQAYAKIRAGASLVQVYSMLVYHGPAMVHKINRGLASLLKQDGFQSLSDAVGVDSPH